MPDVGAQERKVTKMQQKQTNIEYHSARGKTVKSVISRVEEENHPCVEIEFTDGELLSIEFDFKPYVRFGVHYLREQGELIPKRKYFVNGKPGAK